MSFIKKSVWLGAAMFLAPALAAAQFETQVLAPLNRILDRLVPIVVTLAVLYFFWGLSQYILAAGDEGKKEEGRRIMIWGTVALFVMVSVWGLVNLLGDTFNIRDTGAPPIDQLIP